MENVIETRGLSRKFGEKSAVHDLNLNIKSGEVFGFLGHNGAGKTTTIHMLTTLLSPTSGVAKIGGYDCVSEAMHVRRLIGYVPENVRLYEKMTALENLVFFAEISGVDNPRKAAIDVLEFLNCVDYAGQRVGEYSKGMRQRIGIAQAILHKPSALFLDEPTSGLDPMGVKMLREVISDLNTEFGMTIFMNTHILSEIAKTCHSIGVLNHGKLVFQADIDTVMARYGDEASLEALYLNVTKSDEIAI
jgi:ABC-2 type transport system ATP-binding protein